MTANPFDHHSPEFARDWTQIYEQLRSGGCPVTRTPRHGGFYVVATYADARRVLQDTDTYASGRELTFGAGPVGGATIPVTASRLGMMEMDPPESLAYRRLIAPFFSERRIREYTPRLRTIIDWVLDRSIAHGQMDIVDDLAAMLPPLVIVDLLGLPLERWHHYADVLHQGVSHEKGSASAIVGVMKEMRTLVDGWRSTGTGPEGVCTALLEAEVDGNPIPNALVAELVFMLLTGGVDTTTAQISNVVHQLDADPELRERLIRDPRTVPGAMDELLRLHTPGTGAARTVVTPATIGDVGLIPGDRVFVALGSANRDSEEFDEPDAADLDRAGAHRHLSFGYGVHRCVGAHLAKAELVETVHALFRRMPDFAVDRRAATHRDKIPLVNGWTRLPVTFTPGNRVLTGYDALLPVPRTVAS